MPLGGLCKEEKLCIDRLSSWRASWSIHRLRYRKISLFAGTNEPLGQMKGVKKPRHYSKKCTHAGLPTTTVERILHWSSQLATLPTLSRVKTLVPLTPHHSLAQNLGQPAWGKILSLAMQRQPSAHHGAHLP